MNTIKKEQLESIKKITFGNYNKLDFDSLDMLTGKIDDGPRYVVQPKQVEFLRRLQTDRSQTEYTEQEQVCIAHCIRYGHYSNVHKDTLNNLIKKYTKDG